MKLQTTRLVIHLDIRELPWWKYTGTMAQPFAHEELPLKQHFIDLAREFNNKSHTLENELAAALLYMNVADYLAEYLVIGLSEMSKEAMNRYYLGMVSIIPQQRDSFNIGNAIYALKGFDFPKKTDIMQELNSINTARKKIAHQILKTKSASLPEIDEAVKELIDHTEALVVLVDDITPGMPPTNLLQKLQEASMLPDDMPADENTPSANPKKQKNGKA